MKLKGADVAEMTHISIEPVSRVHFNQYLEYLSPQQIVRWAVNAFGPNMVMASAFGLNGIALIHMLQQVTREIPIVFVDTGYSFEETLEIKRRIIASYGVRVLTYRSPLSVGDQARQYGADLPARHPDLCCALRKVEPMRRAMADLCPSAVLSGRARFQASTRQALPVVEWDQTPVRINPLALWSQQQIEAYIRTNAVPYNPLHDVGYPSIGCQPCTRPVLTGEHIRAGRWAMLDKTECGLWTANYAVTS